jgi:hypothetical protein
MASVDRGLAILRTAIGRRGRRLLRRIPQCRNGILLNTMPKSGSAYISGSLATILQLNTMQIGHGYALIDQINIQGARTLSRGGFVSQAHLAPSSENLQVLQYFKQKLVLHLRDPRQALLSWVHHLDWISGGSAGREELLYAMPQPPSGYFDFPLTRKIDWHIENYLPQLIAWSEQWVEVADRCIIPILITRWDDLRSNEKTFFDSILAFYQLNFDYALPSLPRTMEATHFRRADPAEWIRSFTPEQADQATLMIPQPLRTRFGWHDPAYCSQSAQRWIAHEPRAAAAGASISAARC